MEDLWRERLDKAKAEYAVAYGKFLQVIRDQAQGPMPTTEVSAAVQNTRLEQSRALEEYQRVLKIFTGLTIDRKIPEEH